MAQAQHFELKVPERCASVVAELTVRVQLSVHDGEESQELQQSHR